MRKLIVAAIFSFLIVALLLLAYCYHESQNMPVPIPSFPCGYGIDENGNVYKWIPTVDEVKEVQICQ